MTDSSRFALNLGSPFDFGQRDFEREVASPLTARRIIASSCGEGTRLVDPWMPVFDLDEKTFEGKQWIKRLDPYSVLIIITERCHFPLSKPRPMLILRMLQH